MAKSSNASADTDGFYSRDEVLRLIPFSVTTLWREIGAGRFPKGVKLSPRRVGFPKAAVHRWLREKEAADAATS